MLWKLNRVRGSSQHLRSRFRNSVITQSTDRNHRHQLEALAMMIDRERGAQGGDSKHPSLWEPFIENGHQV